MKKLITTSLLLVLGIVVLRAQYCLPVFTSQCTSADFIDDVTFNTINNLNTGCAFPGTNNYSNYTAQSTSVTPGLSYTISLQSGSSWSQGFGVWIDYNQNFSFADPGEFVFVSTASSTAVQTGTITIPVSALAGATRMRVLCRFATIPLSTDFCASNMSFGECEDYTINILPTAPCVAPPVAGTTVANPATICPNTPVALTLSGAVYGSGQTYQWQSSPNGVTWTNIAGATSPTYSTSTQTALTYYQCVFTCAGNSVSSTPVLVNVNSFITCYCNSNATSTGDEEIFNVTVGSLNNSSTCTTLAPGPGSIVSQYSNYKSGAGAPAAPALLTGTAVPFSVQIGTCGGNYSNATKIFIDYNQNGLFTDPGEEVYVSPASSNGPHTETGTFTVPILATPGTTAMRVVCVETTLPSTVNPCGTYTWGETEDYLVNIIPPSPNDLGVSNIFGPITGCALTSNTQVNVTITNFGNNPQTNPTVSMKVDNGAVVTEPTTLSIPALGGTGNYTFTATANLSTPGFHTIKCWTNLAGDGYHGNDTMTFVVLHKVPINTYPYVEAFSATLPVGWEQSTADQGDWDFATGATMPGPQPTNDHTTGNGYYAVVDDYTNVDSVILITPCFDLAGLTAPEFSFWYHSFNQNFPNIQYENFIHVDMIYNGSMIYDVIPAIGHKGAQWDQQTIDLTPYAGGVVGFRFRADNNNLAPAHNLAIDDINLKDLLPQDASVTDIVNLPNGCGLSATQPITITIKNTGSQPFTTCPVHYILDNGVPVNEIYNGGAIFPGSTANYTFATTANLSVPGFHTIVAYSTLPGDTNLADDSTTASTTTILTVNTYPYLETFATGANGWTSGGTNSSWALGNPTGAPISAPYSFPNCWETNLNGNYNNQEQSWVQGPCFNFASLNQPVIEMAIYWDTETNWDGIVLQSSIDNGATWQNVGAYGDPNNWYNAIFLNSTPGAPFNPSDEGWNGVTGNGGSGGWVMAKHDLVGLNNQPNVRLRIAFSSDFSGLADGFGFDNVYIYDKPPYDFGASRLVNPPTVFCSSNVIPVSVTIRNYGSQPQTNIPVEVKVTGPINSTINTIYPNTVPVGDSAVVNVGNINASLPGVYNLKAYTTALADPLHINDTLYRSLQVYPAPASPVSNGALVCSPSSMTLTATNSTPGSVFFWYDAPFGNLLGTGPTYTTPVLSTTTTYYVQAKTELSYHVGKLNNAGPGFNTTAYTGDGFRFHAYNPVTIDSVHLYPSGAGTVTIQLIDSATAGVIGLATVNVPAPNGVGNRVRVPVNLTAPVPGNYSLVISAGTVGNLFYNFGGAVYPYVDPGNNISIYNTVDNLGVTNGYHYHMYDWVVSALGCESGFIPVDAIVDTPPPVDLGPDVVACAGYELDATTIGGVNYAWNTSQLTPIITAASTGLYIVNVTNTNGCVGVDSINVSVLPAPNVNLGPDIAGCVNSAVLDAGVQAGGFYIWSPNTNNATSQTVTVTQSGIYYVSVTNALGCVDTDSINVQLNGVDADLGQDIIACSAVVTLNAGNPGATYAWSTGATTQSINVSQAGTYSVTVVSGNCVDTDVINVTFGSAPSVNLGNDQTVCDQTVIDAGNPGATYSWSNGNNTQTMTVTQSGTYSVAVSYPGGCIATDQINITVVTSPTANFVIASNPAPAVYNFNATSTTGSLPLTYLWNFGDGSTSNLQNPTHGYQTAGNYTVTLIVTSPMCGSDTTQLTLTSLTGIDDMLSISDLSIFPNPANTSFTVSSASLEVNQLQLEMTDVQGKSVYVHNFGRVNGFSHDVNVEHLAKGVYIVKLSDGTRNSISKVIIE